MKYVTLSKASNWPTSSLDIRHIYAILGGLAFSAAYGAIHAAAWNYSFPSPGERLFWRASVMLMTVPVATPLIIGILVCLMLGYATLPLGPKQKRSNKDSFQCIGGLLVVGFVVLYVVARLFIVVESFRDLFYLPEEVYKVPRSSWTRFIPHGT